MEADATVNQYKEVEYVKYCHKCKYEKVDENSVKFGEVCQICLSNPVNSHSHKPVNFEKR